MSLLTKRSSSTYGKFKISLLVFSLVFALRTSHDAVAATRDTIITEGEGVQDWDHLESAGGIFRLGFFSPGASRNRYLGISYNKARDATVVWVGNRNTPIADSSGLLTIDGDGKLKITHSGGSAIMLYSKQTAGNVTATLLDSGNFVLREVDSNGTATRVLWQSFDYPTNTLLPGMKLGFNSKTGHNWSLTSWLTNEDLSSGDFSLGGDPMGTNQLLAWRRRDVYWKSGVWDGRSFKSVPELTSDNVTYNFSYVWSEDERYFTYSLKQNSSPPSFWVLDSEGNIRQYKFYNWNDDTYDSFSILCPTHLPYNYSRENKRGCVEQKVPGCRRGELFYSKQGYMDGPGSFYTSLNASLRLRDCADMCWSNCSCIAYKTYYAEETGCQLWNRDFTFRESSSWDPIPIYILGSFLDQQLTANKKESKDRRWLLYTVAIVVGVLMPLLGLGIFYCLKRRSLRSREQNETNQEKLLLEVEDGKEDHELKLFSLSSIVVATDNFSSENKLGQGGFGPVYKGKLAKGQEIAVKRLSRSSGQGMEEFKNELLLIAKLQHVNLVRLLGCCIEGEEKILIYEYMPKKSLDSFLFDPTNRELLDWNKRFHIIEGIAQGLIYLHQYSRLRIIHRDLKESNVLLDNELNPKISDFGMAKIFGRNEDETNTNRIVGTYGYMSPEYAMDGIFSVKSDVYSFGILLLEIVSGRKNTGTCHSDRPLNLVGCAWELWKEEASLKLVDPTLVSSCCRHEQLIRCIHVGLLCVQESPSDRPTMSDVASMLSNEMIPLPDPKRPGFFKTNNSVQVDYSQSQRDRKLEDCSINHATITVIQGR